MTSIEFSAYPPRVSDGERERALEVLREGAAEGRLSHDTFIRRTEAILQARWQEDLYAVLHDLPARQPRNRWLFRTVGKVSSFPLTLRRAWRNQRLPELLLPAPGPHPLSIGRAPGSMLRLNDFTVSRMHAQLRGSSDGWHLRDLGSSNGTWLNDSRVTGTARVRPGDRVRFGDTAFRLALPRPASTPPPSAPSPPGAPLPPGSPHSSGGPRPSGDSSSSGDSLPSGDAHPSGGSYPPKPPGPPPSPE